MNTGKTILRWMLLLALVSFGTVGSSWADDAEMSDRDLKKTVRQAAKAKDRGAMDEARQLYDQVLAATEPGDARRKEALAFVLMHSLSTTGGLTETSQGHLDEILEKFPRHPSRPLLQLVQQLRQTSKQQEISLAGLEEELVLQKEACEEAKGELSGEAGEQQAELDRSTRRLRQQLKTAQEELEATQAELAKKEEALEKLKDALVGGGR